MISPVDYTEYSEVYPPQLYREEDSIINPSDEQQLHEIIIESSIVSVTSTSIVPVKATIVRIPYGVAIVSNRPCIQSLRAYMSAVDPLINSQSVDDPSVMDGIKRIIGSIGKEKGVEEADSRPHGQLDINHRMVYEGLSPYNLVAVFFASLVSL